MTDGAAGPAGAPARRRLAIAVPTYNEAESLPSLAAALESTLAGIPSIEASLLVIDDASPDGTGEIADRMASSDQFPHLTVDVLHRRAKEGLGAAYVAGMTRLLESGQYDLILQMDADFSHNPEHIPHLLERSRHADLVVGSRYVPGGATPDWSWYRKLVSRLGNRYARLFLGSRITDYTGGFNLFSVELLRAIDLSELRAEGYGFIIELKYAALRAGAHVAQVPITFMDRRVGASKIPRNTIAKNLLLVPRVRFSPAPTAPRRPTPDGGRRSPEEPTGSRPGVG